MRQISFIAVTAVALSLGACAGNPFATGEQTTTQPSAAPSPVASATTASPAPQSFPSPTVKDQGTPRGILPPDLISSTNPDQRVQQVRSERSDPFALLPTTVPVIQTVPQPPQPPAPPPSNSGTVRAAVPPRLSPAPNLIQPNQEPAPAATPAAPPPPQPVLAKAVKVTGVVQVGNTLFAIVDAPNEPSSRYVQAGQRLSNGQVLVRRIEMNGSEPVVVFEQFGIEVITAVGEGGPPAASGDQPAA